MALDDLISTESAFVAAATAAVFSPRTREIVRRGAVLGVAGALKAGDVVTGAARGVVRGARGEEAVSSSGNGSGGSTSGSRTSSASRTRRASGPGTGSGRGGRSTGGSGSGA